MAKLQNRSGQFSEHKFVYFRDDIFSSSIDCINNKKNGSTVVIPHVCNNIGLFDGGFSGEIETRFPEVAINFNIGGKIKIGNTQFITVMENQQTKHKLIIANMVAQNNVISNRNRRPLHYPSLIRCMYSVRDLLDSIQQAEKKVRIHAPKFGSGLAGGNWNFISDLIDDIWSMFNVSIYTK